MNIPAGNKYGGVMIEDILGVDLGGSKMHFIIYHPGSADRGALSHGLSLYLAAHTGQYAPLYR